MLDKARLTIIASVPLTMTFNLFLLNCYYYPRVENNIQESININTIANYKREVKKETVYERKKTNNSPQIDIYKDIIFNFSPPASHTFIVNDSLSSRMEESESMKSQGIIIK